MTMTLAGRPVTKEGVRGTIELLRYYRKFLGSRLDYARDPEGGLFDFYMPKDLARRRLGFLLNVAINRKAGIPDVVGRRQQPEYQNALARDCQEIRDHLRWRRRLWGLNGRRFQTDIIQKRYGHLLTEDRSYD